MDKKQNTEEMEVLKTFMNMMEQYGMKEQAKEYMVGFHYVIDMQLQMASMTQELQKVREQLAKLQESQPKVETYTAAKKITVIQKKSTIARKHLSKVKNELVNTAKETVSSMKNKGREEVNHILVKGIGKAQSMISECRGVFADLLQDFESAAKRIDEIGNEIKQVGNSTRNVGRLLAGKKRKELSNEADGVALTRVINKPIKEGIILLKNEIIGMDDVSKKLEEFSAKLQMPMEEKKENETELAVAVADRYISIHEVDEGYDYTIYNQNYKELDGGVYDNPDISIREALNEIVTDLREPRHDSVRDVYYRDSVQGQVDSNSKVHRVDYDTLVERAEQINVIQQNVVEQFRQKTLECFQPIGDITVADIEATAYAYVQSVLDDMELGAKVVDVAVSGSRSRGMEDKKSDIDIVVEYAGNIKEDVLFNALHEDGLKLGGIDVDINPITEAQTGTMKTYLPQVEHYFIEKIAGEIDEFAYGYDTYAYQDEVSDREEHIASIKTSIETGDTGYLKEWLNEIIEENEYTEHVSKSKQLLKKLQQLEKVSEYKPLAKVEELEEGNYNKIDGLIDNSEKHNKKENEAKHVRISIREKMAEKKEEMEKRKKQKECEAVKGKTIGSSHAVGSFSKSDMLQ